MCDCSKKCEYNETTKKIAAVLLWTLRNIKQSVTVQEARDGLTYCRELLERDVRESTYSGQDDSETENTRDDAYYEDIHDAD